MSKASKLELLMIDLINAERAKVGVAPLKIDDNLNSSSEAHSRWMLDRDIFDHTGANGSSPKQRMEDAGYKLEGTWATAENIGWRSTGGAPGLEDEVRAIHQSLMNSPGHRANILNPNVDEVGIGIEHGSFTSGRGTFDALMVTENFGRTDAQNTAPTPTPVVQPPPAVQPTPVVQPQPAPAPAGLPSAQGGSGCGANPALSDGLRDMTKAAGDNTWSVNLSDALSGLSGSNRIGAGINGQHNGEGNTGTGINGQHNGQGNLAGLDMIAAQLKEVSTLLQSLVNESHSAGLWSGLSQFGLGGRSNGLGSGTLDLSAGANLQHGGQHHGEGPGSGLDTIATQLANLQLDAPTVHASHAPTLDYWSSV